MTRSDLIANMKRSRNQSAVKAREQSEATAVFLRSGGFGIAWDAFLLFTSIAGILAAFWMAR